MATIQTDGTSPVTKQSTDNNGGTVKANGNVSGTFQAKPTSEEKVGVFGSTVIDNDSADPALSDGIFAYNNQDPVAKKLTSSLAGTPNDYLLSGAADPNNIRSIHKLEVVRTRRLTKAIRQNKFNRYTGKFEAGYPQTGVDDFYDIGLNALSTSSTDDAATPTRDNPGELTFIGRSISDGSTSTSGTILTPTNEDYKPRTN